jgi:multiple sugar transport system permease protein
MSVVAVERGARGARTGVDALQSARAAKRRRYLTSVGVAVVSVVLIIWSVLPIYNMVMVSFDSHGDVFSSHLWPPHPSAESYLAVITQSFWYLQYFWEQFGRSVFLAAMTVLFTLAIGTLAAFSVGRLRVRHGWLVTNCALLTYVIPASFLAIPFYRLMAQYGMMNNLWAVIAALVAFLTPYAIFIFQQYGRSIPIELDEAARIDGASPIQIYSRIYLPLMVPALVAVGTFAMLAAWNEFLYQFLLLSNEKSMTVPIAIVQFLNSDQSPWNLMMATAVIYALPPVAVYYAFRRYMASGLTMGGVKG